jgi:hypothetical protein
MAQDQFPDVPENHWAYEALANLKAAGILVGYPDGLYRGGRPASRYELAVALHAAYQNLKNITDGLAAQIAELKDMTPGNPGEIQALKDRLAALENQVNAMKSWGDDIANLKRMADTFQRELQSLGVDVEAMKRDLGDLADRVTALENRKWVDISGDANFWIGMGNSNDGEFGLDVDGRIHGTSNPQLYLTGPVPPAIVGMDRDLSILHEVALTLAGTNKEGPKWKGTIVVGNMLSNRPGVGFGNQSTWTQNIGLGYKERAADIYVQDFGIKFDTSVAGLGFNAEVGRVGYKVSPYIFQRLDKTSYFANDRWDNGLYYFDGGILGFNFGSAKLDVFGGRTTNRQSVNGVDIDPVQSGVIGGLFSGGRTLNLARTVGANLNVPITTAGNLNLAYLFLGSDINLATIAGANNMQVYGGSVDFAFGGVKVEGSYAKSDLYRQGDRVLTSDNSAWDAKLSWSNDKFGLFGGYRQVEANFLAPGDWGRLGIIKNPTNIKGFYVGGNVNISNAVTLHAKGEFDNGLDDAFQNTTSWGENTDISDWSVGLGFKVSPALMLNIGYENARFSDLGPAFSLNTPEYRWTTIGLGYGFSDKAKLNIQYQFSDIDEEYVLATAGIGAAGRSYKGGFLTTQLSIKF